MNVDTSLNGTKETYTECDASDCEKRQEGVTKQLLPRYEIDAIPLSNLKMIERKIYKVYMGKPES